MARYIDADELLKYIKANAPYMYTMVAIMAGVIPTAEVVEVKHGRWEIVKGSNGKEKMVCTDCRHQQDLASTFTYCPNCGAKMDGMNLSELPTD